MKSVDQYDLSTRYSRAHDIMRNTDGLQPQEAFDELLKFLFFKQANEKLGPPLSFSEDFGLHGLFAQINREVVKSIKELFSEYVNSFNSWFLDLWKDTNFHLSDAALLALCQLFNDVEFSRVPFDMRSAALKEFLTPDIRRGLGIYLTPDDVVTMMVKFVDPPPGSCIYDPACGSGTFLIETLKLWKKSNKVTKATVWGTDKNPRMLLISELNLGHFPGIIFERRLTDALFPEGSTWPKHNSFDIIFTNPPFGVTLDNSSYDLQYFKTCCTENGHITKKQQSEVVFVEQAFHYLKPGGILAIVLPKSVITNSYLHTSRIVLDKLGYIYAAVSLPPETFATTGTQTSTFVIFAKKYETPKEYKDNISMIYADVTNVGYDSTGRLISGNQLEALPQNLHLCLSSKKNKNICRILPTVSKGSTFAQLKNLISYKNEKKGKIRLRMRDVVEVVTNGKTSPRKNYTEQGLFVVKVGNLTGNGINWLPRNRNYISKNEVQKREEQGFMLQSGDILLTSSAHSVVYIAKKVDIVFKIPKWVGGVASFVGEVMMIRPNKQIIDPFVLLAYLRFPNTVRQIQQLVRGQTAHLYPDDILDIPLPSSILKKNKRLEKIVDNLHIEASLNQELNDCAFDQNQLLENTTM